MDSKLDRTRQPAIQGFDGLRLDFPAPVKLSNGIPLWVIGNGEDEISRLNVYMGGGTIEEEKPMQALITGYMVMEGSAQHNSEEIAEALDYYGAWKAAQHYNNHTMISLSSLNRNFEHTVKLLCECITSPTFPGSEFDLFKSQLASNIATASKRVTFLCNEAMNELYYGKGHPLARPLTPEGVMAVSIDDLKRFHDRYYNANNCQIVLAGKISQKEIDWVDQTMGQWSKQGVQLCSKPLDFKPSDVMFKMVDRPGVLQSAIGITIRAIPRRHPDYFKLRLTTTLLGGYFGSRLMTNIREEKGYTYGIQAFLAGWSEDSYVAILSECDTRYTMRVVEEVKREIERLKTDPVAQEELDTVRQYMLGELAKTLDTPFSMASYVSNTFLFGTYPEYFNDQVKAIEAMTVVDVKETANQYFKEEKMRIVIAGDKINVKKN